MHYSDQKPHGTHEIWNLHLSFKNTRAKISALTENAHQQISEEKEIILEETIPNQ